MASWQRSGEAGSPPAGVALGLQEEKSHPALRCSCGPVYLRLRSEHGELIRPRGGCVNRCDYCARAVALENSEMLGLDALQGDPPQVLIVLGTRDAFPELPPCECDDLDGPICERCSLSRKMMAPYGKGLRCVKRALKRRWPSAEYAWLLEYTTGYGERSGGKRRPHWNLLWKGIPVDDCDRATAIAARIWCKHVDAEVQAQHGTPIYSADGLFRYLAKHFQKSDQSPPAGFTGKRFSCSEGYFTGCTSRVARARACESLALDREIWKQTKRDDADAPTNAHDVQLNAQLAYRVAMTTRWVLVSETGSRLSDDGSTERDHGPAAMRARLVRRNAARDVARAELLAGAWLPDRELALFTPGLADVLRPRPDNARRTGRTP